MSVTTIFRPTGDVITQLSPTVGSDNYACVDEATFSSDYVANTVGYSTAYDVYSFSISGLGSIIESVTVFWKAEKTSSINYGKIAPKLRISSSLYTGAEHDVGGTDEYQEYSQTYATNPATGDAWTRAEVMALQAGLQQRNPAGASARIGQMWLAVVHRAGTSSGPQIIGW
jgi:hypothetical protein